MLQLSNTKNATSNCLQQPTPLTSHERMSFVMADPILPTDDSSHNPIKAIPAAFNGITYRSRLEARWAVFFDCIGLQALYEWEGYQTPHGWYLPDFYFPTIESWFEIKPETERPDWDEQQFEWLTSHTSNRLLLARGFPRVMNRYTEPEIEYPGDSLELFSDGCNCDSQYYFCLCPFCRKIGIEFNGRGARVCNQPTCNVQKNNWDKWYTSNDELFISAFDVATRYRFW